MSGARFTRRAGVETQLLDGAAVLVLPGEHLYFAVNRIGGRIWELLATPQSLDEIVAALAAQFDVAEEQCRREADEFLRQLAGKKLVERLP